MIPFFPDMLRRSSCLLLVFFFAFYVWGDGDENGESSPDEEFDFPPLSTPLLDDTVIGTYNVELVAVGGTGTAAGIGFILYGLSDIIARTINEGRFSHEADRGLFFVSFGFVVGGLSFAVLKSALEPPPPQ
ncbi:MAG: hypothetical protein JW881_05970 [Spirochaetales bacterium]|nr:hypothetical protein [Spirochaetales bacterium]